jgi:hypothetical protein
MGEKGNRARGEEGKKLQEKKIDKKGRVKNEKCKMQGP